MKNKYFNNIGGMPEQHDLTTQRAKFTNAFAVIPAKCMRDIVTSNLPHWRKTRAWVLARPMSGFSETFSHYILEVAPKGGSNRPDEDELAQAVLFVVEGTLDAKINGKDI